MRPPHRLASRVLVPLLVVWAGASARAQQTESIDDPKVARRLGTRLDYVEAAGVGDAVAPAVADAAPVAVIGAGPPEQSAPTRAPRLMLGYRRFTFAHIGAKATSGPGADEAFDVVSLDFFPISSTFRLGLSTQYGWQEGTFRQNGDVILAETLSAGFQSPGPVATPFVDGYAGAGLMQRTNAGLNSEATLYDELGVEAGAAFFLAQHLFLSASLAYLHAQDSFLKGNVFGNFAVDTWSFKLGVGL
ncbi:MAG TPA: hypothetical protein VLA14_17455 [Polyangia bacterium]|jgi:hypothetical protein|nr:hypothetical protein [Polyangia bacterium]